MSSTPTRIGYWHGLDSPGLPHPHEFVDAEWNTIERGVVVAYLQSRKGRAVTAWRGSSYCRICGCTNGSEDISDGVYRWPSGYAHYIEAHDVRPPQAFIDHVMASRTKEKEQESMKRERACPHCGGTGSVMVEDPVGLLRWRAGNEYDVMGGAPTIFEVCNAASLLARGRGSPVCFDFNGTPVEVHPDDNPATVANAWWVKTFGETQEESYARR